MKVCLAGNPNSGKTTLFNALTGSTAHVGNWPGVTVDKKTGVYKKGGNRIEIVDLPGIYSLSPYTPEEIVSRDFLLNEKPDAIINIVDATNLERNLYLSTQLLELDIPVIIALNMSDLLKKSKDKLDVAGLQKAVGVPVVEISALRGENILELMNAVSAACGNKRKGVSVMSASPYKALYDFVLDGYLKTGAENAAFRAVKLIEGDEKEVAAAPELNEKTSAEKAKYSSADFDGDYEGVVADARYKYITEHFSKHLKRSAEAYSETKSDKIDKVLTHRVFGIPIFLGIMFAVFHIIFSENFLFLGVFFREGTFDNPIFGTDAINSPGVILFNLLDWGTSSLGEVVAGRLSTSPEWVGSLINDGILGGLFAVLSFVPQIMLLFLFLSLLEDSGYMARVAFIMDRAFRRFGLSGKAFLPMLMCFGCAVPGIMATKTLENEKERDRTIFLTPFFSCGAKMPIWATFAALMFGGAHGDLVVFSIYFLGIAIAVIAAILLNKTFLKGEIPPFIMELPTYHSPQARNLVIHLWEKLKHYIVRAGTIILGSLIVIWFLSSFGFSEGSFGYVDIGDSLLAFFGKGVRYVFYPLGFGMGEYGWMLVVAAFTGLIAKEMVPATLAALLGITEYAEGLAGTPFDSMVSAIPVAAIYAFMAFNLLAVPCMAAVAAARGELRSRKRFWQAIGFWMATAYTVALVLYWSISYWWIGLILAVILAALVTVKIIVSKKPAKERKIS